MVPAWHYMQVRAHLQRRLAAAHSGDIVCGFLFAPLHVPLARDEIAPGLDYFHHRSGECIDFFCAGYGKFWQEEQSSYHTSEEYEDVYRRRVASSERRRFRCYDESYRPREVRDGQPVAREDTPWVFSAELFNHFRSEIEERCAWQYSGDVDLVVAVARSTDGAVFLDFTSNVLFVIHEGVRPLFEAIFRLAGSVPDPTDLLQKISALTATGNGEGEHGPSYRVEIKANVVNMGALAVGADASAAGHVRTTVHTKRKRRGPGT